MWMTLLWAVVFGTSTWQFVIGQNNLLINPSFEKEMLRTWRANRFTMERYSGDAVDGIYSLKCSGRTQNLEGPAQWGIPFKKGHHYVFEGYAKLLNEARDKIWQNFKVVIEMGFDGRKNVKYIIAYRGFVTLQKGWMLVKGSIEAPMKDPLNPRLVFRGPDPEIDFLVDNFTLYEVEENPNWRTIADDNIETYRKSNINFNVFLPPGLSQQNIELEISLKRHLFAFGAKVEEYELGRNPITQYEKLLVNLFNWATVQSYKWKYDAGRGGVKNFSRAIEATKILNAHGLKVRGHSILWDLKKNVPNWVKDMSHNQVRFEVFSHIQYMMNLTKGTLVQFDVQNEHIPGHYYEERLKDKEFTKRSFRQAKAEDPNGPVLFLNEFQCVTSGANTEDFHDLAMEYLREGVPLEGLGIQGHTKQLVKPDPTAMWRRLDRLAESGLVLMMTEFDIGWPNVIERADWFEDAIRAFFAYPGLQGVILWGFWNGSMKDVDHELVTGPNVYNLTILEPGERWACLTQKEWTTKVTVKLVERGSIFLLRGFRGDYEVIVKNNGIPVQRVNFTLGNQDTNVNIYVTQSIVPIEIPEVIDYVPQCISHRAERILGTGTSSSSDSVLTCRTVNSVASGSKEDDAVSISCQADEVMTGCSSYQKEGHGTRKGEKMEVTALGRVQCTAYNVRFSNAGVIAIARCCKMASLTCDYITAGPSSHFDGAMAEARCGANQLALGCSAYQPFPDSDSVRPSQNSRSCLAQSGAPSSIHYAERCGIYVFSACCNAPSGIECLVIESPESGLQSWSSESVSCPAGYTMTGCNAFAESGGSAGAVISDAKAPRGSSGGTCLAILSDTLPQGSSGVKAYATCCKSEI